MSIAMHVLLLRIGVSEKVQLYELHSFLFYFLLKKLLDSDVT